MRKTFKFMAIMAMGAALALTACGKDDDNAQGGRYTLTVQPNNADWGAAMGSGSYQDGTSVTIEAAANTGYYFIKWSDGAVSNPRSVTVSRDMMLYALFSANASDPSPYNPLVDPEPEPVPEGFVDLGLPSGLLWAKCNLGATTPEGHGDYYAWGETTTKSTYNWSTYKYCNGSSSTMTKYCSNSSYGNNGFTDNLTTLQAMDDAAAQKLGDGARMPTAAEWRELIANTTAEWTQVNGVNGRKFTASNGKSLFLPAAGYRLGSELGRAGSLGGYWSSSLYESGPGGAWDFDFLEGDQDMGSLNRYYGLSVRAVRSQN